MNGAHAGTYSRAGARANRRVPSLAIRVAPSLGLACALAGIHAAAAWVVATAGWPLTLRLSVAALLSIHAAWIIRRHALLQTPSSVTKVRLTGEGECELQLHGGKWLRGPVHASSVVLPWMVLLRVADRGRGRLRSVALLPDSMRAHEFRRLRTRLRWSRVDDSHRPAAGGSL